MDIWTFFVDLKALRYVSHDLCVLSRNIHSLKLVYLFSFLQTLKLSQQCGKLKEGQSSSYQQKQKQQKKAAETEAGGGGEEEEEEEEEGG